MLLPPFQNHWAQLETLGHRLSQMALGPGVQDLSAAVHTAQEALILLKSAPASEIGPDLSRNIEAIESRLSSERRQTELRKALEDLTRVIQSLGVSSRPFLFIVQNAPDQQPPPKSSLIQTLGRYWDRGEHDKAKDLLERIALAAREGDPRRLAALGEIVTSNDPSVSVNIAVVSDVLRKLEWRELILKLIDPRRPLLVPWLRGSKVNPNLLVGLLRLPPHGGETADTVAALDSVLKKRGEKDPWGLRQHAAQGLFHLTTPAGRAALTVFDYWKRLIEAWMKPFRLPVLNPSRFAASENGEARWDLYEEHLRTALSIAENPRQPLGLRRAALESAWGGYSGADCAPKPLWMVVSFRTRDLASQEPGLVSPTIMGQVREILGHNRPQKNDPLRTLEELKAFLRSRPHSLRLVSSHSGALPSPRESLKRLASLSENLGAYGIVLDPAVVRDLIRKAVRELILPISSRISSEDIEAFRRRVYALHPVAAVTGWLDETGQPWPSYALEGGHRLEGALALLRWIRDREKEPEEIKRESARKYRELEERLAGRRWRPVQTRPEDWWERRLTQDLPAALARQARDTRESGAPWNWQVHARNHPEVLGDLEALARSNLAGARALAEQILQILKRRPMDEAGT